MQFLYTVLYILLFIFCLSVLVVVHEFGHFTAAKFFKVYVKEFSVGFGPALIHKKRKNGETYFSLRAIPFGGYVAMYGEGGEVDPDLHIDESRSYDKLKRWKKIIILFSGVFNNAILALVLFFIANSCFIQKTMYLSYIDVTGGSKASEVGLVSDDYISTRPVQVLNDKKEPVVSQGNYYIDSSALITYDDDTTTEVFAVLTTADATYTSRSYDNILRFFGKNDQGYTNMGVEYKASTDKVKSVTYIVTTAIHDYKQYINSNWVDVPKEVIASPETGIVYFDTNEVKLKKWDGANWVDTSYQYSGYDAPTSPEAYSIWRDVEAHKTPHALTLNVTSDEKGNKVFEASGLSFFYEEYWNNAGQMFGNTFRDFGNSATIIFRGLGSLFTSTESWKDVGGIVAIGVQTTNILQNFGLAKFIYIWGLISVNLAIVNLLPFPGLDGWQILVLAVEGIFHKEIPPKVKGIVSFIGIALLFALMIMILVKDVIGLF